MQAERAGMNNGSDLSEMGSDFIWRPAPVVVVVGVSHNWFMIKARLGQH